jgi:hypothetical protein
MSPMTSREFNAVSNGGVSTQADSEAFVGCRGWNGCFNNYPATNRAAAGSKCM